MKRSDWLVKGDQIFISYKSDYAKEVEWFAFYLKSQHFNVWRDADHLKEHIGEPWWDILQEEIQDSDVFLAFLTYEYFFKSTVCPDELALAQKTNKFIIPLILKEPEDETQRKDFYARIKEMGITDYQMAKVVKQGDISEHVPLIVSQFNGRRVRRHLLHYSRQILAAVLVIAILGVIGYVGLQRFLDSLAPKADELVTVVPGSNILRLAAAPDGTLYYAALEDDQTVIYKLDAQEQPQQIRSFDAQSVRDMHVDCKNTLWLLLQVGQDTGVFTYPGDFRINAESPFVETWNLDDPAQFAIDSRCVDGTAEVWLGGGNYVHTVRYEGEHPTAEDVLALRDDDVYRITSGVFPLSVNAHTSQIFDIQYVDNWLWVLDGVSRSLLGIDLDRQIHRDLYLTGFDVNALLVVPNTGDIYITSGLSGVHQLNLLNGIFETIDPSATSQLEWSYDTLWMGTECVDVTGGNCPLFRVHYREDNIEYNVDYGINDMLVDVSGHTWFATTQGLKRYR